MEDCIFCKIVNKEIPCYKIFENDYVLAFLDIASDYYGHTLVIPKIHYYNILDISESDLNHVINAVKKISVHYTNSCGFDGVNLLNANNSSAEQSVMHLHFHIIPRKDADGLKIWPHKDKTNFDLSEIANKLQVK